MIQAILLVNNEIVISQAVPETDKDTGEAYFNLMYPYLLTLSKKTKLGFSLTPWLNEVTDSTENFIIYPDKIITVKQPKEKIVNHYKKLVLFDENKILKEQEEVDNSYSDGIPVSPEEVELPVKIEDIDEVFEEEEGSWDFIQMSN